MKLSVGRRGLNALQTERGEMYSPICIYSPHHISTAMNEALTQAPPLLPGSQSQNLSQHVFYTMQRKLFLGFAPSRTLGEDRVCLHTAGARRAQRELERERKTGCFSQKSGEQRRITLCPSCGLKLFLYDVCKICFTFVSRPWFCFDLIWL